MKRYANLQALCERALEQDRANSQCVPHPSAVYTRSFVNKTRCTDCTVYSRAGEITARVPKMARGKIPLARRIYCYPYFFLFPLPRTVSPCCDEHVYLCTYLTVYELPSPPNNTTVKHFYTNREQVLTGYLSLGRRSGDDWTNTWHWTELFTVLSWNRK